MADFNTEVGLKIFNARKKLKMSRAELGKKVNLHESTIKRYEDGHIKSLDIEKLKEFARALDISSEYLMGWEDIKILNNVTFRRMNNLSEKERNLLFNFNKLNTNGKDEAIKRVSELALIPSYKEDDKFEIDTIAAHNDHLDEPGEMKKIMQDLNDMDNW